MALHRVIVRDEADRIIGIEFVTSAKDRDAKIKEHKASGRKAEAATGHLEGFNFVEE